MLDRDPLVSVIVPIFNGERFLAETIESVRAQTYTHWELLLVDDGSTDGSGAIARSFANEDPARIRCLEHSGHVNRGENPSRKLGLSGARGRFVALLDADDVWLPHKLSEQVPLLAEHPDAGMLYGTTKYWYSWTGETEDMGRDWTPTLGAEGKFQRLALLPGYFKRRIAIPCTCSVLARREALRRIGAFDDVFANHGDQAFYVRMMANEPVVVVEQCWDLYRRHPDSITAAMTAPGVKRSARLKFLSWVEEYLRGLRIADADIWSALRYAKRRTRYERAYHALSSFRRRIAALVHP